MLRDSNCAASEPAKAGEFEDPPMSGSVPAVAESDW